MYYHLYVNIRGTKQAKKVGSYPLICSLPIPYTVKLLISARAAGRALDTYSLIRSFALLSNKISGGHALDPAPIRDRLLFRDQMLIRSFTAVSPTLGH